MLFKIKIIKNEGGVNVSKVKIAKLIFNIAAGVVVEKIINKAVKKK